MDILANRLQTKARMDIRFLTASELSLLLEGKDASFEEVLPRLDDIDTPLLWAIQAAKDEWEDILLEDRGPTLALGSQIRAQGVRADGAVVLAFEATHSVRPRVDFSLRGIDPESTLLLPEKDIDLPLALAESGALRLALARHESDSEAASLAEATPNSGHQALGTHPQRL